MIQKTGQDVGKGGIDFFPLEEAKPRDYIPYLLGQTKWLWTPALWSWPNGTIANFRAKTFLTLPAPIEKGWVKLTVLKLEC